jgi:rhomboid-like protein
LFAGSVVAFNHLVLPWAFQMPGISTLRRHPDYVVWGLMAINGAGFLAWKSGRFASRFMYRYGLLHKDRQFNVWQMLGSAFSHQELWHVGLNMFVLYQFGMPVARWMGSDQFLAAYMDGAVLSSLGSIMFPLLARTFVNVPSLGASGAVFGIFGIFSYLVPHAKLALFFIPLPIGAWGVFLGTLAYNAAGIFWRFGGSDYAGHVAGSLVGIVWGWLVSERIRRQRERARAASQHVFIRW